MKELLKKHRFTVADYHRMAEVGILSESDRVELVEGEVVGMSPIGSSHAGCVNRLVRVLSKLAEGRALLGVQNPLGLSDFSEPQPDVVLLRPRADDYAESHPDPTDVLLLIEVADTSLEYDRDVKVPVYARAGIPEVWLLDLNQGCVEVYREPSPNGYRQTTNAWQDETLRPVSLPEISVRVDDLLA